ncbi:MAG: hypothetical protein WCT31_03905, partial [Candidatus Micrarchaeia archaeon]
MDLKKTLHLLALAVVAALLFGTSVSFADSSPSALVPPSLCNTQNSVAGSLCQNFDWDVVGGFFQTYLGN